MTRIATTAIPYTEFDIAEGNFDRTRSPIDRLVLHTVVGTVQSAITRFGQSGAQVSAHYIVGMDGKLYHGLEETFTAYHSGNYSFNQRSIGIEHEDKGQYNSPRPDALYATSAKLVADICKYYNIPCDATHIVRHQNVQGASTACPDALDTNRIINSAKLILAGGSTPTPQPPMADNITRKSGFFDKWWQAYYGTDQDTDKVTEKQATDRRAWSIQERDRAGNYDQVINYLFGPMDSNKVTAQQVIDKIKAQGDTTALKQKVKDFANSL